jgi:hypothetical protein
MLAGSTILSHRANSVLSIPAPLCLFSSQPVHTPHMHTRFLPEITSRPSLSTKHTRTHVSPLDEETPRNHHSVTCPSWLSVGHGMEIVQALITRTNQSHAGLFVSGSSQGQRRAVLVVLLAPAAVTDCSNKTHSKLPDPRVADGRAKIWN